MTFRVPGNFYDLRPNFKIILEDTWQRRVEALIARHGLTTEQRAAVDAILRDCRGKAAKLLEQRKELLDECDEVGSRVHLTPKGEPRDKLLAHLSKVRDELSLEIHRVFETELVPRVEALLTEEQRARGKVNPPLDARSRPAAPPG